MNRLIIIVEGDTEKEFVDRVLSTYLIAKGVQSVSCFKIKHTRGGLTKYQHLKTDLINCLFEESVVVTTLIDFYALPKDFPKYNESVKIVNKTERLDFLENAIKEDIEKERNSHFPNLLPYIQLHEFESLVFSSLSGITSLFGRNEANFDDIQRVIDTHPNPEDINDSPHSAPSKRLKLLIKGYNKVNDGIMIIEEIGINTILRKCPRFSKWIDSLVSRIIEK